MIRRIAVRGYTTNCASKVDKLPPSFRFPPLREGNRAGVWFATLREGNRAGVWFATLREGNRAGVWFATLREGKRAWRTRSVPPACRGNLEEGVLNGSFWRTQAAQLVLQ
jgi:hypothetical protein